MKVVAGPVQYNVVLFDQLKLIDNAEKEVRRVLKPQPKTFYTIANGHYEMFHQILGDVETVVKSVERLMLKYNDETKNNYAPNWLRGVYQYKVQKQGDISEYAIRKSKIKAQGKRKRNNSRR